MPIKDKSRYPKDWPEIRQSILTRAGNRCERCGVPNHTWIVRSNLDKERYLIYDVDGPCLYTTPDGEWIRMSEVPGEFDGEPIRVVLTIAHLDHEGGHDDSNLRAYCQRCHNLHDGPYRAKNAARTRRAKKRAQKRADGQKELFSSTTPH